MKTKKQTSRKNEFRYSKTARHPVHVYAKEGNEFKYLGITHSKKIGKTKTIKLSKNPNPEDERSAYFNPLSQRNKTNKFTKPMPWKLSKKDNEKMKPYRK